MTPTPRRMLLFRVALYGAMAVIFTAQFVDRHRARRHPADAPPAVATPSDTRRVLHIGSLSLHSCEIGRHGIAGVGTSRAYCTRIDVPENWNAADGRHIALAVAIVRSTAVRSERDLVVFLDGGPGGAATEDYPEIAPALSSLRQRRDVLLVDQRGTGGSNALTCRKPEDTATPEASLPRQHGIADNLQLLRQCLTRVRTHAAPEFYTTTDAVRDLEAVRQALGAPPLDLLGISYGTRVAQQYAARYPQAVRSIVLESPIPNTLALGADHARNLEQVLKSLFDRCSADAACKQNFGDSHATLYHLRDRLRVRAQSLSVRDPGTYQPLQLELSAADLATLVRINAYSPITAALLPLTLYQADHGNFQPLVSQKKWISDDLASQITGGMELSVVCAEDADLLAPRPEDAATLLGNDQIEKIQAACSVWPRGERPAEFHSPFTSSVPVLILSGQYDPVTPPSYGTAMLRTLGNARQLLAPGQGHAVIGAGCMPQLVERFVDGLAPRALDASCLLQLGDIPAFIDFNGPPP
jgi:pimeloyl-ACP methyl ester carboxylesterase